MPPSFFFTQILSLRWNLCDIDHEHSRKVDERNE